MHFITNKINQASSYLLPIAVFFILISSSVTNIFIVLTILISIFFCIKNKNFHFLVQKKSHLLCIIIYFLLIFSTLYSIADTNQIIEVLKKYIKFIYIPILFYYIKIFDNRNLIIKSFIIGCTIILCLSYLKFFDIFDFELFYNFLEKIHLADVKEKIIVNNTAIFQHYIIQGIVLSFYSFLCLYLGVKEKKYTYCALSIFAFINVLFLNDSRASYILIIFLLLLSIFFIIKNVKIIISFLLILAILMFSQFSENFESRFKILSTDINYIAKNNYDTSLGLRYLWAKVGFENLREKPIFGFGAGSFKKTAENYYVKYNISPHEKYVTNNPHNEFISISTQLGTFGLLIFLTFFSYLFLESKKNVFNIGIVVTIFISSIFNSAFYDNMLGLFLIIILCLVQKTKFETQ